MNQVQVPAHPLNHFDTAAKASAARAAADDFAAESRGRRDGKTYEEAAFERASESARSYFGVNERESSISPGIQHLFHIGGGTSAKHVQLRIKALCFRALVYQASNN